MTRQRSLVILLLAVASASLAGFAAMRYTSQRPVQTEARETGGTQVVLASQDLPVGHLVTEADVHVVRWPGAALPVGYITEPSAVVGRGLIAAVRTNEPILEAELAERGSGGGLPIVFPEGMRAVSIHVDEVIAVAGWVIPGTRVDILLTAKPNPSSEQTYTQIIMQNLVVLAAGQTVQRDPNGNPMVVGVVTLMVTPDQGEKLVMAAASGRIQLALRNMLDVDAVQTAGVGDARLMDIGRVPVRTASGGVAPVRPRPRGQDSTVVEVYKGGVRSVQRF